MKNLSLKEALLFIGLSVALFALPCYLIFFSCSVWQEKKMADPHYNITTLVQLSSSKTGLDTNYLAEIMGLSKNRPISIYSFDVKKAEKKLLESPLIKKAKVTKLKPSAICVEYKLRKPFLKVLDFENMAIDKDGYLFPFRPFFSEEVIEVRLGLKSAFWHQKIASKELNLCRKILDLLSDPMFAFKLKRIDLSNVYSPSYGKREIILFIEDSLEVGTDGKKMLSVFPKVLRLNVKDYEQQMSNFVGLLEKMRSDYLRQIEPLENTPVCNFKPKVVDLRIAKLAFIDG